MGNWFSLQPSNEEQPIPPIPEDVSDIPGFDKLKLDEPMSVPYVARSDEEDVPMFAEAAMKHFGSDSHLCKYWKQLSGSEQIALVAQYDDFIQKKTKETFELSGIPKDLGELKELSASHYAVGSKLTQEQRDENWMRGLKAISEGKVAAIVLAGGQATRLGMSKPKGTLSLGLDVLRCSDSLLALQAARIACLQKLARARFPESTSIIQWIVMTSNATHRETLSHLESILPEFGLSFTQLTMCIQGEFPCFDLEGKFILSAKDRIATSPDGNGGLYTTLKPHLSKLEEVGVKYFHVYCVDNVLCRVADPEFIGYCISKEADCAAKVVEKVEPKEAVGVICLADNKPKVVEYSEISPELATMKSEDGHLRFRAGNIANHFFTIDFLNHVCSLKVGLPYHRALKKIPYIDDGGNLVKPDKPNGYKLERFVFDVFDYSKNFFVYEVIREDEFSPLKNAEEAKKDCLSTCRRDLANLHKRWLLRVNAVIEGKADVFVHPMKSYNGEGLDLYKGARLVVLSPMVIP